MVGIDVTRNLIPVFHCFEAHRETLFFEHKKLLEKD